MFKKGFTLLELLLVLAILAILAAAVAPSFLSTGQAAINDAKKVKFITNYNSLILASNMLLLASDTTYLIRNGAGATFDGPTTPKTSGLGLLVASGVIQIDTTEYENINNQKRYFRMSVGPTSGIAKVSVMIYDAQSGGNALTIPGNNTVEAYLSGAGKSMTQLWDEVLKSL